MDKKDIKIITHLRQDARMPLTKMSKKTHIPVSTIFDRLQSKDIAIVKHTSLLNFPKLGYNTIAKITLKVEKEDRQNLKEFLLKHQSINSVCRINNGYDFMVEGIFTGIQEMEEFIEKVENRFRISDTQSFFVLEYLKREAFLSQPQLLID